MKKFNKSLSAQLTNVAKLHRMQAASLLGRIGLYPGQEKILKILAKHSLCTMSMLAELLDVRPPTVTKMVTRLAAQKLVQRDKGLSRITAVRLTKLGEERAKEISRLWDKLDKKTLKNFRRRDEKKLKKLLRKISKNLAKPPRTTITPANDETAFEIEALPASDLKMSA
ncbi:MAG: MarR family transcriptional regulator [Pseudomonadota bacterium]